MDKKKFIYGVVGLLVGLAIGYWATNSLNRNYANATNSGNNEANAADLPAGHPSTGATGATGATGGTSNAQADGPQGDVMAVIQQAKNEPSNFDAQMKAAALFEQIQRYDQALEFYQKAQQAKPKELGVLVALGNTNFSLQRLPEAERWYKEALRLNARNEEALQNLVTTLLAKGDKSAARSYVQQLEQANPNNQALPQFRAQLN
jgi:tetratricopeptide (TPR) repeat protein